MDAMVERALKAIEKARESDDPPPNLLLSTQEKASDGPALPSSIMLGPGAPARDEIVA
jgi:hypothetical protein